MAGDDNDWNHAHLLALVWTPAYAAATIAAGWSGTAILAVHLVATLG
jgi:hypothetical protein